MNEYYVGDKVLVYAPGTPWHSKSGTILHIVQRHTGTQRYSVVVGKQEIYVSTGSLKRP